MTKIDIISGFLGAGKTTFIKKLLKEAFKGEQVVLIENEFGEIGIDGGFLKEAGIEIKEMNSGCICCSLVGDFEKSLKEVIDTYHPDRILIEPSGVGKLSDVIKAVQDAQVNLDAQLNSFTTVVDVTKCRIYSKNFGEFFSNQIEYAGAIILSRTDKAKHEKVEESVAILRGLNEKAPIITTPIEQLSGEKLLETMEASLWKKNFWQRLFARNAADIMITMRNADVDMTITMITTTTSTNTITMSMMSTNTTITSMMSTNTTIMSMKSMSTIITTMIMAKNVDVDVDTIIIMTIMVITMLTKYSQVGVKKQSRLIQKKKSAIF